MFMWILWFLSYELHIKSWGIKLINDDYMVESLGEQVWRRYDEPWEPLASDIEDKHDIQHTVGLMHGICWYIYIFAIINGVIKITINIPLSSTIVGQ